MKKALLILCTILAYLSVAASEEELSEDRLNDKPIYLSHLDRGNNGTPLTSTPASRYFFETNGFVIKEDEDILYVYPSNERKKNLAWPCTQTHWVGALRDYLKTPEAKEKNKKLALEWSEREALCKSSILATQKNKKSEKRCITF